MKTLITIKRVMMATATGAILAIVLPAAAQYQEFPQYDQRVGPVYPGRPYSFQQRSVYSDPYRFNWNNGSWMPFPGNPGSGYQLVYSNGVWKYQPMQAGPIQAAAPGAQPISPQTAPPQSTPGQAAPGQPPPPPPPPNAPAANSNNNTTVTPRPNDTGLWTYPVSQPPSAPTTQPATQPAPPDVKFSGSIVGIKAIALVGDPQPHLLLRLHNSSGANGTIDVGTLMALPQAVISASEVTAYGKLGDIDGNPVLFADRLDAGKAKIVINRDEAPAAPPPGGTPAAAPAGR